MRARNSALRGIRVADFTWVLTGPFCTLLLAQMGAEVIKIESKRRPDPYRTMTSACPQGLESASPLDRSPHYVTPNYDKKGCCLDLTNSEAASMAKEVVKISDVVVENFGHGVMESFGMDYPSLQKIKPDLIMASISGLGRSGPAKHYASTAMATASFAGLHSLTGYDDGRPQNVGGPFADVVASYAAVLAILAALRHRAKTGTGQYIDVSLAEAAIALFPEAVMDYTINGRIRGPAGNRDEGAAPQGCYRCKGEDKWVAISVTSENEWRAFCSALGNPSWTRDERFGGIWRRRENQDELDRLIQDWTLEHEAQEVMEILQQSGVAGGPSLSIEELLNDAHLQERGFFVELENPATGKYVSTAVPWRTSVASNSPHQGAPLLGQHNREVFGELIGLSEEEIERLHRAGAIY